MSIETVIGVLLFCIVVFMLVERAINFKKSRTPTSQRSHKQGYTQETQRQNDPRQIYEENYPKESYPKKHKQDSIESNAEALKAIKNSSMTSVNLLNYGERQVYWRLVKMLSNQGYVITTQVSLGEILESSERRAFQGINAKRADFLILDKQFAPIAVVEYYGTGHYGETKKSREETELRDLVKKTALEKAGIDYIVVNKFDDVTVSRALEHAGLTSWGNTAIRRTKRPPKNQRQDRAIISNTVSKKMEKAVKRAIRKALIPRI